MGAKKRILPLLGLLLLVLTVVAPVAPAFAQNASKIDTTFPYLGPDSSKRDMIASAYLFQMSLFKGVSEGNFGGGATGGSGALFYLGLAGTLVGALLIIFFPKYQKPDVLVAWLLIVIVVMFGPYKSRLFFYPLHDVTPPLLALQKKTPQANSSTVCGGERAVCGFTPQLAAIHLASTLQVAFSDLFRSYAWKGLMDSVKFDNALRRAAALDMGAAWGEEAARYARQCSNTKFEDLLSDNPENRTSMAPVTMADGFGEIFNYFKGAELLQPPPIIMLPASLKEIKDAGAEWSDSDKAKYIQGMNYLYKTFTDEKTKAENGQFVSWEGGGDGSVSVEKALGLIKTSSPNFFGIYGTGNIKLNPGYFITTKDFATQKIGDRNSASYNQTTLSSRACFVSDPALREYAWGKPLSSVCVKSQYGAIRDGLFTYGGEVGINPISQKAEVDRLLMWMGGERKAWAKDRTRFGSWTIESMLSETWTKANNRDWEDFFKIYNDKDNGIAAMPVAMGYFNETGSEKNGRVGNWNIVYAPECTAKGRMLYLKALDNFDSKSGGYFKEGLIKWLKDPNGGIPTGANGINRKNIVGLGSGADDEADKVSLETQEASMANNSKINTEKGFPTGLNDLLARVLGDALDSEVRANNYQNIDKKVAQVILAKVFFEMARDSTWARNMQGSTAEANAVKDNDAQLFGMWAGLGQLGGFAATEISKIIIKIGAIFTGPMAIATVTFINILLDLCLTTLIALTPFLLLAGLVMPTAAAGLLTITVLVTFVLKFVPVTLVLLNNLGWVIYTVIDTNGALSPNSGVMKDFILIGMAGMYAGLVTLTMFLLFKLGDPAALLGRISAIDAAGKDAASKGMDVVKLAAATAATLVAGTATGMIRAGIGRLSDDGVKKDLGGKGDMPPKQNEELRKEDEENIGDKDIQNAFSSEASGEDLTSNLPGSAAVDSMLPDMNLSSEAQSEEGVGDISMPTDAATDQAVQDAAAAAGGDVSISGGNTDARLAAGPDNKVRIDGEVNTKKDQSVSPVSGREDLAGEGHARQVSSSEVPHAEGEDQVVAGGDEEVEEISPSGQVVSSSAAAKSGGKTITTTTVKQANAEGETKSSAKTTGRTIDKVDDDTIVYTGGAAAVAAGVIESDGKADVGPAVKEFEQALRKTTQALNQMGMMAKDHDKIFDKMSVTAGYMGAQIKDSSAEDARDQRARMEAERKDKERPGFWRTVGSGAYGGFMASFQGASMIPFVGKAISEAWNEDVEAEMRLRDRDTTPGGMAGVKLRHKNAQRAAAYSKMTSDWAGAEQYVAMREMGAFKSHVDNMRNASRQAVAQMKSLHDAYVTDALKNKRGVDNAVMTSADLRGMGAAAAYDKVAKIRAENIVIDQPVKIVVPELKDGKITGYKESEVKMSHRIFDRFAQQAAIKSVSKFIDESGKVDYGVTEKHLMRHGNGFELARKMYTDKQAAQRYVIEDAGTDYVASGEYAGRTGKEKFYAIKEAAALYSKFATQEQRNIDKYLREHGSRLQGVYAELQNQGNKKYVVPADVQADVRLTARFNRARLEDLAKDEMKKDRAYELPLTINFDAAGAKGASKVYKRINGAIFNKEKGSSVVTKLADLEKIKEAIKTQKTIADQIEDVVNDMN